MFLSATGDQVKNQFLRLAWEALPLSAGVRWLGLVRNCRSKRPSGGFLFGRSTDTGGHIEGLHDQVGSLAGLLVDECKSIRPEVRSTHSTMRTSFRSYASSNCAAFGGFYNNPDTA